MVTMTEEQKKMPATVTMVQFKNWIFKRGKVFEQFVISPYSGEPRSRFNGAVVVSSKINEPTYLLHKNRRLAVILPAGDTVQATLKNHLEYLKKITGVDAPCFTAFDIFQKKKLFEIG